MLEGPADTPASDPVADRIRFERLRLRLTLADLAGLATRVLQRSHTSENRRPASVSSSYICLIERGHKVPEEPIAVAIAEALGDDAALYRAWVRTRKRADLPTALAAAETLSRLLPRDDRGGSKRPERRDHLDRTAVRLERSSSDHSGGSSARLRLPLIAEGVDPGQGVRPTCEVIEWLRLDPERLASDWRDRLDRPFAVRLTAAGIRRVAGQFEPGDYAIVMRSFIPLQTDLVYVLRHEGRILMSHVLWNGNHLVALPATGENDFLLLEARDEPSLRAHILGVMIAAECDDPEA